MGASTERVIARGLELSRYSFEKDIPEVGTAAGQKVYPLSDSMSAEIWNGSEVFLGCVDLPAGEMMDWSRVTLGNDGPVFVHVIEGQCQVGSDELSTDHYAKLRPKTPLRNSGGEPARVGIMYSLKEPSSRSSTQIRSIANTKETKPGVAPLKSLYRAAGMSADIGYEYVRVKAEEHITDHLHEKSTAIVLITQGKGWCHLMVENEKTTIECCPGKVICIPKGTLHTFEAGKDGLAFVSAQNPAIGTDYVGASIEGTTKQVRARTQARVGAGGLS